MFGGEALRTRVSCANCCDKGMKRSTRTGVVTLYFGTRKKELQHAPTYCVCFMYSHCHMFASRLKSVKKKAYFG